MRAPKDSTDPAAAAPAAHGVRGLQDGAAVPPIAAASTSGGDAASSPKRDASSPTSSDQQLSAVTVLIPRKTGMFGSARSTPFVTTQFWLLVAVSIASSWCVLVGFIVVLMIRGPK